MYDLCIGRQLINVHSVRIRMKLFKIVNLLNLTNMYLLNYACITNYAVVLVRESAHEIEDILIPSRTILFCLIKEGLENPYHHFVWRKMTLGHWLRTWKPYGWLPSIYKITSCTEFFWLSVRDNIVYLILLNNSIF